MPIKVWNLVYRFIKASPTTETVELTKSLKILLYSVPKLAFILGKYSEQAVLTPCFEIKTSK